MSQTQTAQIQTATGRIVLVRHGQTAHNHEHRVQGHTDVPLDETGYEQSRKLAAHLRGLGVREPRIEASDLLRARATAEVLHAELGGTLTTFPALREIFMGDWEGVLLEEVAAQQTDLYRQFWSGDPTCCAPNGETPQAVGERVYAHVLAHWPQAGETLILVSHSVAISTLLTRLLPLDYQTEVLSRRYLHVNSAYSVLEVDPLTREVRTSELALSPHL